MGEEPEGEYARIAPEDGDRGGQFCELARGVAIGGEWRIVLREDEEWISDATNAIEAGALVAEASIARGSGGGRTSALGVGATPRDAATSFILQYLALCLVAMLN